MTRPTLAAVAAPVVAAIWCAATPAAISAPAGGHTVLAWRGEHIETSAQAINDRGRGIVIFDRGRSVWEATVDAGGRVVGVAPISLGTAYGGASDLAVGINDEGRVVATWIGYTGRQQAGPSGFGFQKPLYVAAWRWGQRPGVTQVVSGGAVQTRFTQLVTRPDGMTGLLYTESGLSSDVDELRFAMVDPSGRTSVHTLQRSPDTVVALNPVALGVDDGNRFIAAWHVDNLARGKSLDVAKSDTEGNFGAPQSFEPGEPSFDVVDLLVDGSGNQYALGFGRDARHRAGLMEAERAHDAPDFAAARLLAGSSGNSQLDAAVMNGQGRMAVVWREGSAAFAAVCPASRACYARRNLGHDVAGISDEPGDGVSIDSRGRVIVAFTNTVGNTLGSYVIHSYPGHGLEHQSQVASTCLVQGVAGAPAGPTLLDELCGHELSLLHGRVQRVA